VNSWWHDFDLMELHLNVIGFGQPLTYIMDEDVACGMLNIDWALGSWRTCGQYEGI
jgi:hypothetical protein